jgi:capsular exopolysaccharide synthesis family protein
MDRLGAGPSMTSPRYSGLDDYLHVLRVNWLVILAITVLAGGVAFVLSERKGKEYEGTAVMAFQDDARDLGLLGSPPSAQVAPDQLPATRAQTISSLAVARRVQRALRTPTSPAVLASKVSTAASASTGIVRIGVHASDQTAAARLADTFAREARTVINATARRRFARQAAQVRRRLKKLPNDSANGALRGSYADQLSRLVFLSSSSTPASVLSPRGGSASVVPRHVARNAAIGLLLGLVLGVVVAFVRDVLDRRLRGSGEIEGRLDLPLLGRVRTAGLGTAVGPADTEDPKHVPDIEAFRIIRQNLEFLAETPPHLVAVTSALADEGKSTVAASLAATTAATGRRTLLVECDLRRPSLTARLGLAQAPGLVDYLNGEADRSDVLQWARPEERAESRNGASRDWPEGLVCIPAGSPTRRPAELLGGSRMRELLREAASSYDLVVLDTSPLLPVADTLELLPLVDAVLLCVRSGRTTSDQALAAKAAIAHFPRRPTGLVVTGVRPRDEREYRANYGPYTAARPVG